MGKLEDWLQARRRGRRSPRSDGRLEEEAGGATDREAPDALSFVDPCPVPRPHTGAILRRQTVDPGS